MDTRFLDTFLLVAEHGSLAEAARRSGLTSGAIAQRIQALEDGLGVPLLLRNGRVAQPTEAGHAIIEQSRRILADVRNLRGLAQLGAPAGELRLGAISTALTGLLPPAIRRLKATVPSLEVFVLPGTSTELYHAVNEGRIDAAIVVHPPFVPPKSLNWRLIRAEPMLLLAPAEDAKEKPRDLLETRSFIRYDRNNWGGKLADSWLRNEGISPREWLELDQLDAIAIMVSNGLGVSILPDWAPPWPQGLTVARLPLPGATLHREIGMVWPRAAASGRLVKLLIDALDRTASAISRDGRGTDV